MYGWGRPDPACLQHMQRGPHARSSRRRWLRLQPGSGRAMERHALADVMKAMGRRETVHGFHSSFSDWAADNTAFPQEVREQALADAIPNTGSLNP